MFSAETRARLRKRAEDLLAGGEREAEAQAECERDERRARTFCQFHTLVLKGEDGVETERALAARNKIEHEPFSERGTTFYFDIYVEGKEVGHGHLFWFSGHGGRPFRMLDWNLYLRVGVVLPSEELRVKAGLEDQLPPQFRLEREWSKEELEELSQKADAEQRAIEAEVNES